MAFGGFGGGNAQNVNFDFKGTSGLGDIFSRLLLVAAPRADSGSGRGCRKPS